MPISLRARLVVPVDRPPLAGGVVTIDRERIVAVTEASQASGPVRDLGDVALLPSFVNAHTHLEFSHLKAPLGRAGMPLIEWLPLAIAERQNRNHQAAESIALGVQESLLAGTCAVGEIATADAAAYKSAEEVAIAQFLEVIGFSRARAASAFASVAERLAAARKVSSAVGLSPHAPYTVSPALLRQLVDLACEERLGVAMHLAESREELELLADGAGPFRELLEARSMWDPAAIPAGSRPLDYLRLLAEAPRALVIHGNYLDRDEHEFLAAHADRLTLVYCPRTQAYFAHPPYPLAKVAALGVRVALGTDSRASNPDLNLLAEVRHVARHHADVAPDALLAMATLNAARAIGCEQEYGSITAGKFANLVALPCDSDSLDEVFVNNSQRMSVWLRGREI
jgi:cytosine/adenosine deaminase-related metal-dependent hydrolase